MASRAISTGVVAVLAAVGGGLVMAAQQTPPAAAQAPGTSARPLLLEQNEGELRTRRVHTDGSVPASAQFLLKVSPKNNGSQHLVAGSEVLPPGANLPKHRHLTQDEILLIQGGTARVSLGEEQRDLHSGALVFIPANTWIGGKNIGAEPITLTFIFSAPGFEDTMRCNSVAAGETPTAITPEEQLACAHLGHSESAGRSGPPAHPKQ